MKRSTADAPKKPLDPRLVAEENLGFLIWDTARAMGMTFGSRLAHHGITTGMVPFLRTLWVEDGLTQAEIRERSHLQGATTVVGIKSLEQSGFVRRVADEHDKRKTHIFLTPKGKAAFKLVARELDFMASLMTAGMNAKQSADLMSLLGTVRKNIQSYRKPGTREKRGEPR